MPVDLDPESIISSLSAVSVPATPSESITILAQPDSLGITSTGTFNTNLENVIINSLARNIPAERLAPKTVADGAEKKFFTPAPTAFTSRAVTLDDRNTFSIETTTDISDTTFALTSQYQHADQNGVNELASSIFNIGTSSKLISKSVAIVDPSAPIYDSNIKFDFVENQGPFYFTTVSAASTDAGLYPTNIDGYIPNKDVDDLEPESESESVSNDFSKGWKAEFDLTNTDVNYQRAINSEYNTSGQRPITIEEDVDWNKANALGQNLITEQSSTAKKHTYFTFDSGTGKPSTASIATTGVVTKTTPTRRVNADSNTPTVSGSHNLYDNHIVANLKSTYNTDIALTDAGTYKIHQEADKPLVTITAGTTASQSLAGFPLFNGNVNEALPTNTKTLEYFKSMFDSEAILPGYKYQIDVDQQPNSGYSVENAVTKVTIGGANTSNGTQNTDIFSHDDSKLEDDRDYMQYYANGVHQLYYHKKSATTAVVAAADHSASVAAAGSAGLEIQKVSTASESNKTSDFTSGVNAFSLNSQREYISAPDFALAPDSTSDDNHKNGKIWINNRYPTGRSDTINSIAALAVTEVDSTVSADAIPDGSKLDKESTDPIVPKVFYNSEHNNYQSISDDFKKNQHVEFLSQLVLKNSTDADSFLKASDNSAIALDLYTNSIVNGNFNTSDFVFTATAPKSVHAEVLKITSSKQLASINGFTNVTDSQKIDGVSAFATLQNMATKLINSDNVYDKSKMRFTLRNLSDSSIQAAINLANTGKTVSTDKWSVSSSSNLKIASSSAVAFATEGNAFPTLAQTKELINDASTSTLSNIYYRISVNTVTSGVSSNVSNSSHLEDYVDIEWSTNSDYTGNKQLIQIPQEMLERAPVNLPSGSDALSPSDVTGFVIKPNTKLSGKTVTVEQLVSRRAFTYEFDLPMRPFTGLKMKSPVITVATTYYIVKDTVTGENYPNSYLQYITKTGIDFTSVTESLVSSGLQTVTGSLSKTDLCDMTVSVMSIDTDNAAADKDLTVPVQISSMYGIEKTIELITDEEAEATNGDIKLTIECDYLKLTNNSSIGRAEARIIFDNTAAVAYELQLTSKYDTNYTCMDWTDTVENLSNVATPATTTIRSEKTTSDYSDKILTVRNGYSAISAITGWQGNYSVLVSYETITNANDTCVLTIKEGTTTRYVIKTKNFTYLNTTAYISNVPQDIYRVDRWMGKKVGTTDLSSAGDASITFTPKFVQVDYRYKKSPTSGDQISNIIEMDTGVYLTRTAMTSTTFALGDVGRIFRFKLKSDQFAINMVGTIVVSSLRDISYLSADNTSTLAETNHRILRNGLTYQFHVAGADGKHDRYSRQFHLGGYRGFFGIENLTSEEVTSTNQSYTIVRDVMTATFKIWKVGSVANVPSMITQSYHVYADASADFVLDNLAFASGESKTALLRNSTPAGYFSNNADSINLGLIIKTAPSMLAVAGTSLVTISDGTSDLATTAADKKEYRIHTQGDTVTFTVDNPRVPIIAGADRLFKPANAETTMKSSFNLDEFTGTSFNVTSKKFSISPFRLRVYTNRSASGFTNIHAAWSFQLDSGEINLYKNAVSASQGAYWGNPTAVDANLADSADRNDPYYVTPVNTRWTKIGATYTFGDILGTITSGVRATVAGITVAGMNFQFRSAILDDAIAATPAAVTVAKGVAHLPSISYFVVIPPFRKFTQVSSKTLSLPYTSLNSNSQIQDSYQVVNSTNVYNPFKASTPLFKNTNEVDQSLTFDSSLLNDITFTDLTQSTWAKISDFVIGTRRVKCYCVVEGSKLTIGDYIGLASQGGTKIGPHLFESLPANRLRFLTTSTKDLLFVDALLDSNSGIQMKLFQPELSNTPYTDMTTSDIYSTGAPFNYNITVKIDNFFILPSKSKSQSSRPVLSPPLAENKDNTFKLDLLAGSGTRVTLYTRETSIDNSVTPAQYVTKIYRWGSVNNVDYMDQVTSGKPDINQKAITCIFLTREVKTLTMDTNDFITSINNKINAVDLSVFAAKSLLVTRTAELAAINPALTGALSIAQAAKTAAETALTAAHNAASEVKANMSSSFETFVRAQHATEDATGFVADTAWNSQTTAKSVFVSINCFSTSAMSYILPMLFSTPANTTAKTVVITLPNAFTSYDKIGRVKHAITYWGSTKTTALATGAISLQITNKPPLEATGKNMFNYDPSGLTLIPTTMFQQTAT